MTSMEGDRFEIRGGRLALKNSSSPAVRRLGRTLVRDHTKSYREAAAAARALGIKPEDSPAPSQVWELSVLNGLRGAAFDRQYASLEVQDHKQDIQETGFEAAKGSDPTVVALARSDLPVLRRHLALSRRVLRRGG
jgi:putative membrane protein